jgi:tetraacyldisaccharide 4'-kinase
MRATLEAAALRVWAADTPGRRALRALLLPAAAAYGTVASVRNRLYDAGWLRVRRLPVRVISVGNLSLGGTGKTPAVLWLAEALAARGLRVAIVARGYGKQRRGVVVVGAGAGPLVAPADGGDEAVMLARRFAGPVVTGERRVAAAALACARFAPDAIVLDDGFQHRALARDADLVLVAGDPAADRLLPAGRLRERAAGLVRAQAVLALDDGARGWPGVPLFRGRVRPRALVAATPAGWTEEPLALVAERDVVAVTGIARPERFVDALTRAGARVRRVLRYPDHHRYGAGDAAAIAAAAGGRLTVTTEKDLVKLAAFPECAALRALRVALEVDDGERLVDLLAGRAARGEVDSARDCR